MVGWYHQLNESEKAPGVGDEQGSAWGCKELDMTERLK